MAALPIVANAAAINLQRYSIPDGYRVTVADGIVMIVAENFTIKGQLVLNGQVRVGS